MTDFYIVATKKDGPDVDRRIDGIKLMGGTILTIDEALSWIDLGNRFFVNIGRIVGVHACRRIIGGQRFLHTSPDGVGFNNLLELPNISVLEFNAR